MPTRYTYEMWKGDKLIGSITTLSPLMGRFLYVPEVIVLKALYSQKRTIIEIPISWKLVSDDGVNVTQKRILDVSRKSNRQIKLIRFQCNSL